MTPLFYAVYRAITIPFKSKFYLTRMKQDLELLYFCEIIHIVNIITVNQNSK